MRLLELSLAERSTCPGRRLLHDTHGGRVGSRLAVLLDDVPLDRNPEPRDRRVESDAAGLVEHARQVAARALGRDRRQWQWKTNRVNC